MIWLEVPDLLLIGVHLMMSSRIELFCRSPHRRAGCVTEDKYFRDVLAHMMWHARMDSWLTADFDLPTRYKKPAALSCTVLLSMHKLATN